MEKDEIIIDKDVDKAKKDVVKKQNTNTGSDQSGVNPVGEKVVRLPTIYLWEDSKNGQVCGAFYWKGRPWGICFPYEDTSARREADKQHLRTRLRDTLDILVHHGEEVVDKRGNINPTKVNDAEANRFWVDPLWRNRLLAFRKAVKFKEISKKTAEELNLL